MHGKANSMPMRKMVILMNFLRLESSQCEKEFFIYVIFFVYL